MPQNHNKSKQKATAIDWVNYWHQSQRERAAMTYRRMFIHFFIVLQILTEHCGVCFSHFVTEMKLKLTAIHD